MSSAVVSTSAALGRPFVFDDDESSSARTSRASLDRTAEDGCPHINLYEGQGAQESPLARVQSAIKNQRSKIPSSGVTPASRLEIRPAPEMAPSGIPALDVLTGGLPRGCLTEICGPASSGRTTVLLAALAAATRRGEFCAVVDATDALDPHSVAAAGVDLNRLLWVRCSDDSPRKNLSSLRHRSTEKKPKNASKIGKGMAPQFWEKQSEHCIEQVLRTTDLLLESGGFGLIILDLADLPPQSARRIPLTTWFRFRRAIEYKPTILLAIERQAIAGSCSSLLLQLGVLNTQYPVPSFPSHAHLLTELQIHAEQILSRLKRKPAQSVMFTAKTAWAG
jgi:hypothetical protein